MPRFRVAEHEHWRGVTPRGHGDTQDSDEAQDAGPPVADLRQRVEALGPIAYPARIYDGVFGRWSGRSRLFLALRFMLVVLAVLMLVGGVNGEALVEYETGTYRKAASGGTVVHYITPTSFQQYIIETGIGQEGQLFASMGLDHGIVRIPSIDPSGPEAYALQVKLVRGEPYLRPELGLQRPDGTITSSLTPTHDDGVTLRYDTIHLDQVGDYKFVVRSAAGQGRVDMQVDIASAPVEAVEQFRPDWLPLVGGVALGSILVGAYTPGATALAQARGRDPERPYRMAQDPTAFADRVVPVQTLEDHPDARLAYRDE